MSVLDGIDCILAPNPKDYTGPGTNTYVVGTDRVWVIDPGPNVESHVNQIIAAIAGRPVDGIFVTHTHLDHSPAATSLKKMTNAKTYGFGALSPDILALTDEDVDVAFVPDVTLAHGHEIGAGPWRLHALHTPGHFPNHMCYMLPEKAVLFSGDHVMGWSTTVVVPPLGNLADYMDSLELLAECKATLMLPSHGDEVEKPYERIQEVRNHRIMRHKQIKTCLQHGMKDPADIVEKIYEGLTPRLVEAAKGCVRAHIELLDNDSHFDIVDPVKCVPALAGVEA